MPALLALSAAICWGVADFLGGAQARRMSAFLVAITIQATGLACLIAIVVGRGTGPPSTELITIGIATGIASGLAFLGVYATLAMGNMARVAPVFGTAAVIPVLVGLGRGEDPSRLQMGGMAAAMIGVMLVSVQETAQSPAPRKRPEIALGPAILTAVSIGLTLVGLDRVSAYDPYWAVLLVRATGTFLLVFIAVLVARNGLKTTRSQLLPLVGIGLIDTLANVLWSVASSEGLLSLVAVLGSVFPAVTVILALAILREPLSRIQAPGVAATLAGSAMIAGG